MNYFRHGDISLHQADEIEKGEIIKHDGSFVLAEGETTGHKHVISVPNLEDMQVIKTAEGGIILRLLAEGTLVHEEHKTLTIPVGDYFVKQEREYDWFSLNTRRVID